MSNSVEPGSWDHGYEVGKAAAYAEMSQLIDGGMQRLLTDQASSHPSAASEPVEPSFTRGDSLLAELIDNHSFNSGYVAGRDWWKRARAWRRSLLADDNAPHPLAGLEAPDLSPSEVREAVTDAASEPARSTCTCGVARVGRDMRDPSCPLHGESFRRDNPTTPPALEQSDPSTFPDAVRAVYEATYSFRHDGQSVSFSPFFGWTRPQREELARYVVSVLPASDSAGTDWYEVADSLATAAEEVIACIIREELDIPGAYKLQRLVYAARTGDKPSVDWRAKYEQLATQHDRHLSTEHSHIGNPYLLALQNVLTELQRDPIAPTEHVRRAYAHAHEALGLSDKASVEGEGQ